MIKETILTALQEVGPDGIKVKELSEKVGINSKKLYIWFSNIGKKVAEIERLGPGHFRFKQEKKNVVAEPPKTTEEEIKPASIQEETKHEIQQEEPLNLEQVLEI